MNIFKSASSILPEYDKTWWQDFRIHIDYTSKYICIYRKRLAGAGHFMVYHVKSSAGGESPTLWGIGFRNEANRLRSIFESLLPTVSNRSMLGLEKSKNAGPAPVPPAPLAQALPGPAQPLYANLGKLYFVTLFEVLFVVYMDDILAFTDNRNVLCKGNETKKKRIFLQKQSVRNSHACLLAIGVKFACESVIRKDTERNLSQGSAWRNDQHFISSCCRPRSDAAGSAGSAATACAARPRGRGRDAGRHAATRTLKDKEPSSPASLYERVRESKFRDLSKEPF